MIERIHLLKLIVLTLLIALSIVSQSSESYAETRLHTVSKVWYSYDTVKIFIDPAGSQNTPQFKYNMLEGSRFYVDVYDSRIKSPLNSTIDLDDVRSLRRAQFKPNISRVVIKFKKSGIKPTVSFVKKAEEPYILVSWNGTAAVKPAKQYKILIDPGHGGVDAGAIGPVKRTKEKDVTLDIALILEQQLKQRGDLIIELTRRRDTAIRPSARRAHANQWKPDIFISIHANSAARKNSSLNQTEIYYYDKKSQELAEVVRDELIDELERDKGYIRRKPFTVIYKNPATFGSVLVESCYISSKVGENYLRQSWYREEIAKGLTNSIETFLENLE